jgi:prepilin-type N-terminal cleavage/methylation domain-containing protein/prepilin-type processing-associated H-X9-DG protein
MRSNSLHSSGFTIVELLVVISVIALLLSFLLPAMRTAREVAKTGVCLSNLRQTLGATFSYSVDCRELPDMQENGSINLTAYPSNHPDFETGVINRDGAVDPLSPYYFTPNSTSAITTRPKWYKLLNDVQGPAPDSAFSCTAQRGDWSRAHSPGYDLPFMGFGIGPQTNAYMYFGPLVHGDDVNPYGVMWDTSMGVKWVSDAPLDATTQYPANWDLRIKNTNKGVLFCCPSPAYDGTFWGGPRTSGWAYWTYNADFVWVRPHGANRDGRNYGFMDGHAVSLIQQAIENTGYPATPGIGYSWSSSPNGYY